MRDMLFRGRWNDGLKNGEERWVCGLLHRGSGGEILIQTSIIESYMVEPETVGQYTGLVDKNGVRIFEGDIVKATGTYPGEGWFDTGEHDYNFTGLVKWDTDMATYILGGYRLCTLDKLVVLGNIHDNPELLEVE